MGDVTRKKYGWFDPNKPIVLETSGTTTNYGFQGYSVPISSISGNTITFASAHGLTVVYPGITRLSISGSSNPAYNTNFYIMAAPTPTTLTVVRSVTDFAGTGTGGTLTYQTGETETISSITATGTFACHGTNGGGAVCGDTVIFGVGDPSRPRHRGQTFTISGNSVAGFNNNTFVDLAENTTLTATYFYFRELPGGNSTGGRAQIVADNYYVKGRNGSLGYDAQPAFVFAEVIEAGILRGAGHRMYALSTNPQGYSPGAGFVGTLTVYFNGLFADGCNQTNQLFAHPHWENGPSVPAFHAGSLASLLLTRVKKFLLQPALNTPDYGPLFEMAARGGSYGNLLMALNMTDGTQARTFSLAPYIQSGQQVIRYYGTWQGITVTTLPAGTRTDTVTMDPGATVIYTFPGVFRGELRQASMSVRLADVPNAAKVTVRYNHDPYVLDQATTTTVDCGIGSNCILPVDRNIGMVYYRLIYVDANGKVLATSDVETL
jgi:hypothetical protein